MAKMLPWRQNLGRSPRHEERRAAPACRRNAGGTFERAKERSARAESALVCNLVHARIGFEQQPFRALDLATFQIFAGAETNHPEEEIAEVGRRHSRVS